MNDRNPFRSTADDLRELAELRNLCQQQERAITELTEKIEVLEDKIMALREEKEQLEFKEVERAEQLQGLHESGTANAP